MARRQRALEELLWLDPVERERRIIAAVAAGDFSADEVDASLRLVMRLDRLREMDLPGSGRLIGTPGSRHTALFGEEPEAPIAAETAETAETAAEDDPIDDQLVGIPIVAEPIEIGITPDYIGVPIVPETTPEADAEMPLDALESAERWEERSNYEPLSPIARRVAEADGEWGLAAEAASLAGAEEPGPSIAWLRPN